MSLHVCRGLGTAEVTAGGDGLKSAKGVNAGTLRRLVLGLGQCIIMEATQAWCKAGLQQSLCDMQQLFVAGLHISSVCCQST